MQLKPTQHNCCIQHQLRPNHAQNAAAAKLRLGCAQSQRSSCQPEAQLQLRSADDVLGFEYRAGRSWYFVRFTQVAEVKNNAGCRAAVERMPSDKDVGYQ